MSRFENIENKLIDFAAKLNAQLSDGREFHRKEVVVYEERRVRWTESEINRMVLIRPHLSDEAVVDDSTTWDFINLAWLANSTSSSIPMWEKYLIYKGEFQLIMTHIEELLRKSKENLTNVQTSDLKKGITRRGGRKPGLQKWTRTGHLRNSLPTTWAFCNRGRRACFQQTITILPVEQDWNSRT